MAIMQSVSRSVLASPNRLMVLLTCSVDAMEIPPPWPILQPSRHREVSEELNWRVEGRAIECCVLIGKNSVRSCYLQGI